MVCMDLQSVNHILSLRECPAADEGQSSAGAAPRQMIAHTACYVRLMRDCVPALATHSGGMRRASFDGRHTMRMMRDTSIRCSTSLCALPMISLGHLDRDWCAHTKPYSHPNIDRTNPDLETNLIPAHPLSVILTQPLIQGAADASPSGFGVQWTCIPR